jgi:hypothetical protein
MYMVELHESEKNEILQKKIYDNTCYFIITILCVIIFILLN